MKASSAIWIILLTLQFMVNIPLSSCLKEKEKRSVPLNGWRYQSPVKSNQYIYPRTDNYYHRLKPDAVVEILMDPAEDRHGMEDGLVELSSITTSVQSLAEYKSSCVKEPGCRWECEPRQDGLPPDCDCVCFYTDAKWDDIP